MGTEPPRVTGRRTAPVRSGARSRSAAAAELARIGTRAAERG